MLGLSPREDRASDAPKKAALAPVFDRLIESNLHLVIQIRGLVRAMYVFLALNALMMMYLAWRR